MSFATEEEKPIAANAKNFCYYSGAGNVIEAQE
jgi:hypothetical protein